MLKEMHRIVCHKYYRYEEQNSDYGKYAPALIRLSLKAKYDLRAFLNTRISSIGKTSATNERKNIPLLKNRSLSIIADNMVMHSTIVITSEQVKKYLPSRYFAIIKKTVKQGIKRVNGIKLVTILLSLNLKYRKTFKKITSEQVRALMSAVALLPVEGSYSKAKNIPMWISAMAVVIA